MSYLPGPLVYRSKKPEEDTSSNNNANGAVQILTHVIRFRRTCHIGLGHAPPRGKTLFSGSSVFFSYTHATQRGHCNFNQVAAGRAVQLLSGSDNKRHRQRLVMSTQTA